MSNVFDYVKSILNGTYLTDMSGYVPFIINKALSYHKDTLMIVNEINKYHFLDKNMQYDAMFHFIKKMKRPFHSWIKVKKNEYLDDVIEYFNCSKREALSYIDFLSEKQLKEIRNNLEKGGIK